MCFAHRCVGQRTDSSAVRAIAHFLLVLGGEQMVATTAKPSGLSMLNGAGLPPEFPGLAGQHEQYVRSQLDEFRSGRRDSSPNQMMARVAHALSDRDIQAVAGYIARMPSGARGTQRLRRDLHATEQGERRRAYSGSSETSAVRSTNHSAAMTRAPTEPAPSTQRG